MLSLPPELLGKIISEAALADRKRLRSTCKLFSAIATPLIFETIAIDFTKMTQSKAKVLDRLWSSMNIAQKNEIPGQSIDEPLLVAVSHMQLLRKVVSLTIHGHITIDDLSSVIANSSHLVQLCIHYYQTCRGDNTPILLLISFFNAFPQGKFSTLQILELNSHHISLRPSTIPSLIPPLRQLTNFSASSFVVPAVFWDYLRDAKIHLKGLSLSHHAGDTMLLHYLSSFTSLQQLAVSLHRSVDYSGYLQLRH
ncbi:uncharacterized protein BT62DRAFT_1011315 [Guyanagaster necrorhizus]|uniref:F-box domain-containing protein n=1 Tax=Guyanagaster necrorhizus TaxID=856835 RepID=A0A9P8APD2_9AGAR|nr:uncharacterized protein BT62DRAFT_1011315 [Guyanagaster necrorhizus MCA 3950]KAG7441742.1 hypothetical protein BT62DRAFT_1011315 [Guyanagaster necrorhizus MCA 3950]